MVTPREQSEQAEKDLSAHASRSTDRGRAAQRERPQEADDFRTEFQRDYTRILHSRAFRRLRHKTQVFVHPKNDHICTRLEHSLHVASVAKTIGRALGLNLDLIDAISIGHDLGHAPFGHRDEVALREQAEEHGLSFQHERQSLRVVDLIESPYKPEAGLNLTFAVRDGILMHYGEDYASEKLAPDRQRHGMPPGFSGSSGRPATLEGCVVRWADKVAYLGRDFEDAVAAGIIRKEELPPSIATVLGTTNREFIATLVRDIVEHSQQQDHIAVNGDVRGALREFHEFSAEKVYRAPEVMACFAQIDRAIPSMFSALMDEMDRGLPRPEDLAKDAPTVVAVLSEFVCCDLPDQYTGNNAHKVLDYIAGMTDQFFISSYTELFLPHSTV